MNHDQYIESIPIKNLFLTANFEPSFPTKMVKFCSHPIFTIFSIVLLLHILFTPCVFSVRVLFIAPYNDHIKSHFALAQTMAEVLARQPFIKYLKIFVPYSHKSAPPKVKQMDPKIEIETFSIGYDEIMGMGNYPKQLESTENGFELKPPENKQITNWPWPTVSIELMNKFRFEMEMLLPQALSKHVEVIKKLREEHYDIGMTEFFFLGNLAVFPLLHIHNVVIHTAVPMFTPFFDLAGVIEEVKHLGVPERKAARVEGKRSFEKSRVEIAHDFSVMTKISRKEIHDADNEFKTIYEQLYAGEKYIGIAELFKLTKYRFINWQPSIDFDEIREVDKKIANLKYIGGIAVPRNLPKENEETKAWFNSNFHSIVLVSFGSVFKTEYMPKHLYAKFIEAFEHFPNTLFIWKFNSSIDEHENNKPKNVAFTNWMQQPLILANPKTKVFISPCGSNSVVDALDAGTPMLCIPVTTDQPYNAYLLAKKSLAQTILIPEIGQAANSQTNPLRIALEELLKWKDENHEFKAAVKLVKEEMSRGETNFVESMKQLAEKIDQNKKEKPEGSHNAAHKHPKNFGRGRFVSMEGKEAFDGNFGA